MKHIVKTDVSEYHIEVEGDRAFVRERIAYHGDPNWNSSFAGEVLGGPEAIRVGQRFSVIRHLDSYGKTYTTVRVVSIEPPLTGDPKPMTFDLTPTDEGYSNLLATFAQSVLSDVKKSRQADAKHLLASVMDISSYLGRAGRQDLVTVSIERIIK